MRRLLLAAFISIALCVGSIVAVMIAGGRLNPKWPPYLAHIELCSDKAVCFWGIMPGNTSMQEAENILKIEGHAVSSKNTSYMLFQVGNIKVQLGSDKDNLNVSFIGLNLNTNESPVKFGDILGKLGAARTIYISGGESMIINFENFYVIAVSSAWPNKFLISVQDRVPFIGIDRSLDSTACKNSVKWQGVRSVKKYIEDQVACYENNKPF